MGKEIHPLGRGESISPLAAARGHRPQQRPILPITYRKGGFFENRRSFSWRPGTGITAVDSPNVNLDFRHGTQPGRFQHSPHERFQGTRTLWLRSRNHRV